MEFQNKVAVITGGASGIGRYIAAQFAGAGAAVCIMAISHRISKRGEA